MKVLRWIALVCLVLVLGGAIAGWLALRELNQLFAGYGRQGEAGAPNTPEPVFFLQDLPEGEIAVLLHPVLTGDDVLLVRDQAALVQAADTAYVVDKSSGGEVFGTVIMAMMGADNIIPVLTVYVDRTPVRTITCNFNQCRPDGWIDAEFHHDIAGLDQLGLPAEQTGETHWDYASYAAAYAAIIDDPNIYFTNAAQLDLAASDDGQRSYRLLLPSSLEPEGEASIPARIATLADQLDTAFKDLDVTLDQIDINSFAAPFVAAQNGWGYQGFDEQEVRLEGYDLLTPNIVLTIPEDQESDLRQALNTLPLFAPDQTVFDAAIDARLNDLGLPPCRPACMVDDTRRVDSLELNQFTPPSWNLRVWQVTP